MDDGRSVGKYDGSEKQEKKKCTEKSCLYDALFDTHLGGRLWKRREQDDVKDVCEIGGAG